MFETTNQYIYIYVNTIHMLVYQLIYPLKMMDLSIVM